MKIGAVLYLDKGLGDSDLLFNGQFLTETLKNKIAPLESIDDVWIAVESDYTGKMEGARNVVRRQEKDDVSFWKKMFSETGTDHLIKIHADSPFCDTEIIDEMVSLHMRYAAEFTYSENLPSGISTEIYAKRLLESIPDSDREMLPLGGVIRSNINQFDAELFYKEPDLRSKRLSFRNGIPRERKIMENIVSAKGKIPSYAELETLIDNNPSVLFVGPSYIETEIVGRCDLDCIFCYRNCLKKTHGDIHTDVLVRLLEGQREFGLPYSLCFGGSGEPMMHSNFYQLMEKTLEEDLLDTLILETNGIYADQNFRNFIKGLKNNSRIKIIVNINGIDPESYGMIHGKDYFETVSGNVLSLREVLDKKSLYVQIMKINETEPFLDKYYDYWEGKDVPIILQKQNTFLGLIKDRRYSDLSPLERIPCWHLQRDLHVLWDGRVCFCKQDPDGVSSMGDVSSEKLSAIWERSLEYFANDFHGKYPRQPDCVSCDEWYTFNL